MSITASQIVISQSWNHMRHHKDAATMLIIDAWGELQIRS